MFKSTEQKYRFHIVDGMKFFESRYYAQKYLNEVVLADDYIMSFFGEDDPMDASKKCSFAIFKREDFYCIVSMNVL